jgi:hypothetical protein
VFTAIGEKANPIGTGTFLDLCDRTFLITASHVLENVDLSNLAVPKAHSGKQAIHTLGEIDVHRPGNSVAELVDIAIVEIKERSVLDIVHSGWVAITLDDVLDTNSAGHFILCGFPSAQIQAEGADFRGQLFSAISKPIPEIPESAGRPVHPDIDIFFEYKNSLLGLRGDEIAAPRLQGVSGASIWKIHQMPEGVVWSPNRALKIVGIQSSTRHGEFFRGKRWRYVLKMLSMIDPSMRVYSSKICGEGHSNTSTTEVA